jgi:hypothetical protein
LEVLDVRGDTGAAAQGRVPQEEQQSQSQQQQQVGLLPAVAAAAAIAVGLCCEPWISSSNNSSSSKKCVVISGRAGLQDGSPHGLQGLQQGLLLGLAAGSSSCTHSSSSMRFLGPLGGCSSVVDGRSSRKLQPLQLLVL